MSEYTRRKNNYITATGTYNNSYRDRTTVANSLQEGNENDSAKSTPLRNRISDLKNRRDHMISLDGPMTKNFEKYVHNIFRSGVKLPKLYNSISAHRMLRIHDMLGSAALNESFDEHIIRTPLDDMFNDFGLTGSDNSMSYSSNYPTNNANSIVLSSPFQNKDSYTSNRRKADNDWKRNNKQMIIDYKGSDITPLTPFMYAEHPYVRSQDSRIVGSNFVQITSRPKDRFLEKIDQTLADVRAMPRF